MRLNFSGEGAGEGERNDGNRVNLGEVCRDQSVKADLVTLAPDFNRGFVCSQTLSS
ncbi:MAG: hypothetical protein NZT92_02215 [Abditibacteriales bacterium]|nr:hypothetical protein [Abditibacteriales bacterium]